jgi:hypothetical protein
MKQLSNSGEKVERALENVAAGTPKSGERAGSMVAQRVSPVRHLGLYLIASYLSIIVLA